MRKNFGAKPWTYPQPVFIVGTYDENGNPDAMNAAWGGIDYDDRINMCLSAGHKTVKNLLATKAFTVSMATVDTLVACDYVGVESANMVGICLAEGHKTTQNILVTKAFTVSMATVDHVAACDYVGLVSGKKEPDKFAKAGFHAVKSEFVNAPVIEELPMTVECELVSYDPESCHLVGRIVNVSADESILNEKGKIDPAKLRPITFDPVNNDYLVVGEKVGNAFKDGLALRNK